MAPSYRQTRDRELWRVRAFGRARRAV